MNISHTPGDGLNPCAPAPTDRHPLHPEPGEIVSIFAGKGPASEVVDVPPLYVSANGTIETAVTGAVEEGVVTYRIGPFASGDRVEYRVGDSGPHTMDVARSMAVERVERVAPVGTSDRASGATDGGCRLSYHLGFVDGPSVLREVRTADDVFFPDGSAPRAEIRADGTVSWNRGPDERAIELLHHPQWEPQYRIRVTHARREDVFSGFGERYNALNQVGNLLDVRVYEEYKQQYQSTRTYMPVPMFITDRHWGLHIDGDERVRFDLDSRNDGTWSYSVPLASGDTPRLTQDVLCGDPPAMLKQYGERSGFSPAVPDWVFGPWMSSNEWNSQRRVMEEVHTAQRLDIPASVVVIEAWSDEKNFYIWNDAAYTPVAGGDALRYDDFSFPTDGLWPDPRGMVDALHRDGIRLLLWQIPVLKELDEPDQQHANDTEHMLAAGFAVGTADGPAYRVRPWWFPNGHVIDFTAPGAAEWWLSKRRYLLEDLGIDGFKTDGGEHLWGTDVVTADGTRGDAAANAFPREYLAAYSREARQHGGVLFSRAGSRGVQTTPLHWAGDQNSTWEEHRAILPAVLSAGLSGIPLVGWDIGGFSGELPDAELYIRSAQMACFGTVMQFHSEFNEHREPNVDRSPWNVAERAGDSTVVEIYRQYAHLRMALIPYLADCAREAGRTGAPVMRPLLFAYPDDPEAWRVYDQYLLGPDVMVAPTLYAGETERGVYLPDDQWIDAWTGKPVPSGAGTITVATPRDRIAVLVRNTHSRALDAILPLTAFMSRLERRGAEAER